MASVFAYGSLVAAGGRAATLLGHRRTWEVAMDNAVALPGYKRYADATGTHPAVHVAFLDLTPDPGYAVDGVLLDVEPAELAVLDLRERNYRRVAVVLAEGAGAWTYVGSPEGRERGRRRPVVVQRAYLEAVRAAHAALGPAGLRRFDLSTDPPPGPVVALVREEL